LSKAAATIPSPLALMSMNWYFSVIGPALLLRRAAFCDCEEIARFCCNAQEEPALILALCASAA
jgi:hypothetical protein